MTWYEILFLKYLKGLPSKARMFLKLAKGGTMQLQPVNDDEPETSPFLGTIRYPDTSSDVEDEFTYKQSSYTGQARIKSIKGNTLVWNQLVQNGNFADTSNWQIGNCTISVSSNVMTVSSTGASTQVFQALTEGYKAGTKFYVSCYVKPSANRTVRLRVSQNSPVGQHNYDSFTLTANTDTKISMVKSIANDITNTRFGILVPDSVSGDTYEIKNFIAINLTQMFGSGNEPTTVDEFTSLFPLPYYAYNSGSLLNFNGTGIKTTGKNLAYFPSPDYEFPREGINVEINGSEMHIWGKATANQAVYNGSHSVSYADAQLGYYLPGTYKVQVTGFKHVSNGTRMTFIALGTDGSTIKSITDIGNGNVNTFTANQIFKIGVWMNVGNGDEIDLTSHFMLTTEDDVTYEPYTTSTTSLPISTYFTNGMKSAGSVYDELSDKAITRVGSVDLGSLGWVLNDATYHIFRAEISNMKAYTPWTGNKNLLTPNYAITTEGKATMPDMTIRQASDNTQAIYVKNNSYSDATTFKSAMSGVYLNYELATYTEQDVDPEDTQIMLNRALSTILGRNVSVSNPQEPLDILTKGE